MHSLLLSIIIAGYSRGGGGGVLLTFVLSPSVFHRGPRHSETSYGPPRESLPEPIGSGSPVHVHSNNTNDVMIV